MKQKWTDEELQKNIRENVKEYGAMVVVAMLYKRLYGKFPKFGMSGQQAEFADSMELPMPREEKGLSTIYYQSSVCKIEKLDWKNRIFNSQANEDSVKELKDKLDELIEVVNNL